MFIVSVDSFIDLNFNQSKEAIKGKTIEDRQPAGIFPVSTGFLPVKRANVN